MMLRFTKMHGIGNDFIVIDAVTQSFRAEAAQMRQLADRHFGIGCDQILIVEPPELPQNDFRYRIFNADGGEVENCGNGARCFAQFVRERGLSGQNVLRVETAGGEIILYFEAEGIRVDMGQPVFEPANIPFQAEQQQLSYPVTVLDQQWSIGAISMGNPHCVLCVDDVDQAAVATLGPIFESHPLFPQRVNVGFMQRLDRNHIRLRVFERGVGETLACGTGACAAVVHGIQLGQLDSKVKVDLPGGQLMIEWQQGQSVQLIGPAETVFEGKIKL